MFHKKIDPKPQLYCSLFYTWPITLSKSRMTNFGNHLILDEPVAVGEAVLLDVPVPLHGLTITALSCGHIFI